MRFLLNIIKRLLIFFIICLGAGVLLEGSLRLAFINRAADVPIMIKKEVSDFVLKGQGVVTLRPGKSKDGRWSTNKDGFRGPELMATHNYRVLVYGDETAHAGHLEFKHSIGPVLTARVKAVLRKDIDVVNAGVPGIGPDQVLERIDSDIKAYSPKSIVVLVNTHNDYGDLIRNRRFYLDSKNRLKKTSHTVKGIESGPRFFSEIAFQSFFLEMMKERKAVKVGDQFELSPYDMTPARLQERLEEEMESYQLERGPDTSVFDDVYDLDVAVNIRSSASLVKLSLMQAVLSEIHTRCEKAGVSVVFVLVPSATDLIVEPVIDYKDLKASYESYMRVNLTKPLTLYLQRSKYPVINLFPGFYKHGANALYSSENPILISKEGVELISEEVVDAYLRHKLK